MGWPCCERWRCAVSDGTVIVDGRGAGSPGPAPVSGGRTNFGEATNGILVQSVGGGGGNAGLNLTAVGLTGAGGPVAVSVGGLGAAGGNAGSATVQRGTNSAGSILTFGDRANGLTAQSAGGAGGVGGSAATLVSGGTTSGISAGLLIPGAVTVGGSGGAGETGQRRCQDRVAFGASAQFDWCDG